MHCLLIIINVHDMLYVGHQVPHNDDVNDLH